MMLVPSFASRSIRRFTSSSGTGSETLSRLVAVGAGEIAPAHGYDVRKNRMMFRLEGARHHPRLP